MFELLISLARAVLGFVVVLGTIVIVHELGHYLAARCCGVHVEAFSIGMGRKLFGWTDRHGTAWKVSLLPCGGYVKLHGQGMIERPADKPPEVLIPGRTFKDKPVLSRSIIVAAGPAANMVLAAALFIGLALLLGKASGIPTLGSIVQDGPAEQAGLRVGDRITALDGTRTDSFQSLRDAILSHPGQTVRVHVQRQGTALDVAVTIAAKDAGGGKSFGWMGIRDTVVAMPVGEAIKFGFTETWDVTAQTATVLWRTAIGHGSASNLGGPLRIAEISGNAVSEGFGSILFLTGVLSINVGLINLVPIPILDGGHLVFFAIEALRRRPLSARTREFSFKAGAAVLASFFLFVMVNDLSGFGVFRWLHGLIG